MNSVMAEALAAIGMTEPSPPGAKPKFVPDPSWAKSKGKPGSKKVGKSKYTAKDLRMRLAELRSHLAMGKSDEQIAEEMSLGVESYISLKRELMRQETIRIQTASAEEIYIEYSLRQGQLIRELSDMVGTFTKNSNYNALVGAVRAKSDILDKIIKTGQDMGILVKAPERKMILQGVVVAEMGNNQLRKMIAGELQSLATIVSRFGDKDLFGAPLPGDDQEMPMPALPMPSEIPVPEYSADLKPVGTGSAGKAAAGRMRHMKRRKHMVAPGE